MIHALDAIPKIGIADPVFTAITVLLAQFHAISVLAIHPLRTILVRHALDALTMISHIWIARLPLRTILVCHAPGQAFAIYAYLLQLAIAVVLASWL